MNKRSQSFVMLLLAYLVCLSCGVLSAIADLDAISETFVDSKAITNNTGRGYQIDSIWVDPVDSTAQTLTFSVTIDGDTFDLDTLSVAGDTAWTADKLIEVPADSVLTVASSASVTNNIRITRSEIGDNTRVIVSGSLSAGAVGTAEIAADAIDGTKIADDAVDSEHIAAGSVDPAHLANADFGCFTMANGTGTVDNGSIAAADLADADFGDFTVSSGTATLDADVVAAAEMADADHGDVAWSGGVATVQGASGTTFVLGSSSANMGYFAFIDNTQLVFVATYTNGAALSLSVTNVIDADLTQ